MRKKIFILFLALFFTTNFISAQQNSGIRGTVRCYDNKELLAGVTVFAEQSSTGTSTDKNGYYELSLPKGT